MRQYGTHTIIRGQQVYVVVATSSRKRAAKLIDDSMGGHGNMTVYHMKTYGYCKDEITNEDCKANPETPYAYLDGGDVKLFSVIGLRKQIPLSEMKKKIDKIRNRQYKQWCKKMGI